MALDYSSYNLGSDEDISIFDLAIRVLQDMKVNLPIKITQHSDKDRPISRYVPSIRRAQSELSLNTKVLLSESIRRTATWYKD